MIRLGYHGSPLVVQQLTAHADQPVRLVEYDIADPFRALRAGELDLMVVKFGVSEPDLETGAAFAFDRRAVVVSATHPLASRAEVSVEEVAEYEAFDRPGDFPEYLWDLVVPRQTPGGRPIRRIHRVAAVPEMMKLVAATHAVHLSLLSLADIAPSGIRVVPVHDLEPAPVSLAWRRGDLPPRAAAFVAATAATNAIARAVRR